ncbi:MAG: hypothetical protein HOO96_17955 [Polyangiaceae bacterium]|nr:hypothetical protein [Polyangiaceae bacterium]
MKKAILISILLSTLYLPIRAAKVQKLRVGSSEAIVGFSLFCVLYLIGVLWVYPALK